MHRSHDNSNAPVNITPNYTGYVGGNIGDFPVLAIDLCSKGGALAHFRAKKRLISIIYKLLSLKAGALARKNC